MRPPSALSPIVVSTGLTILYRRKARAVAKVRHNHSTARTLCAQFANDRFVREAMEAVPAHALAPQFPRQRQALRDHRHMAMERRVEARHLRQMRRLRFDLPDRGERCWQMEWVKRYERS
jgi:hypothetical protein